MTKYLQASISNGNPREQALIRRWWHEQHDAHGQIVWEYFLEGKYADAVWFPNLPGVATEVAGTETARRFPLFGQEIVLCEAKLDLTAELVGQALVYTRFTVRAGARVARTIILAETGSASMQEAARELGLSVLVGSLEAGA